MIENEQTLPWYKQFWPWFLIALPLSVVIAGIITIIIAQNNAVSMVSDNYYKEGLAINSTMKLERNASKLGLNAEILVSSETAICTVQLTGDHAQPSYLNLELSHSTLAKHDFSLKLSKIANGIYQANCHLPQAGKWYAAITNPTASWKINQAALLPNL